MSFSFNLKNKYLDDGMDGWMDGLEREGSKRTKKGRHKKIK